MIVGAITERGGSDQELAPGIPVLGDYASLSRVLEQARADTVVFTGADTIDPRGMRESAGSSSPRRRTSSSPRR